MAFLTTAVAFILTTSASAAPAPPGAIFHSDFDAYTSDWQTPIWLDMPYVTQLDDRVEIASPTNRVIPSATGQDLGRFTSFDLVSIGSIALDGFELSLEVDSLAASRLDVFATWYDAANQPVGGDLLVRQFGASAIPSVPIVTPLVGLNAPASAVGFRLLFFVHDGSAIINEVSIAPSTLSPVPEPTTSMLFALGLLGLGSMRQSA